MKVEVKNKPWEHFIFNEFFSKNDYQILKDFPRLESSYENITGFRDAIDNRVFLNDKFVSKNPQFKSVLRTLNDTESFEKIFGVDLINCSLRPELIDDRYPFFHEVHCDHPDKVLTMLIYIDKDDEQNLASDLYIDKNTHHTKLKWKDNGGIGWTIEPNDDKWHGFKPMKYNGVRRILIINWVKNNIWNDKSQLYLSHRNRKFTFDNKSWNKLNDLERNDIYDYYMDWCGGINYGSEHTFEDNVDLYNPELEDNLYKKLKAYILLCRRYRDKQINMSTKKLRNHLNNFKNLIEDNFQEIINNLGATKWITSILMCFYDLGTVDERNYSKKMIYLLSLNRIDFTRGRTMFTEDHIMRKEFIDKFKNVGSIEDFFKNLKQRTDYEKK